MSEILNRKALVMGAGGFIGHHMVNRLKSEGYWVIGIDLKQPQFQPSAADQFLVEDCSSRNLLYKLLVEHRFAEIYQFAADMGGAGYIFTGANDANVMINSAGVNVALCNAIIDAKREGFQTPAVFYSSSACVYPEEIQMSSSNIDLREQNAYPANPDSEYGWEKLFSERLFLALHRNYDVDVKVARFHNIYGPLGTWQGGKEKAPAAICRKVAEAGSGGMIDVWGDGLQTRSFLYIDDCIEAVRRLMQEKNFSGPVNIGSEEMVSINELVSITSQVAGKQLSVRHIAGPTGVRGRNSNNDLIRSVLDWEYKWSLRQGIEETYSWIEAQVQKAKN